MKPPSALWFKQVAELEDPSSLVVPYIGWFDNLERKESGKGFFIMFQLLEDVCCENQLPGIPILNKNTCTYRNNRMLYQIAE